jgi:hypothetical protein
VLIIACVSGTMWFALQAYKLTISAEETMVREERAVQGGRRYLEDLQSRQASSESIWTSKTVIVEREKE